MKDCGFFPAQLSSHHLSHLALKIPPLAPPAPDVLWDFLLLQNVNVNLQAPPLQCPLLKRAVSLLHQMCDLNDSNLLLEPKMFLFLKHLALFLHLPAALPLLYLLLPAYFLLLLFLFLIFLVFQPLMLHFHLYLVFVYSHCHHQILRLSPQATKWFFALHSLSRSSRRWLRW